MFVCKGRYGQDVPYTSPPKEMQVLDIDKKVIGKVWQYQIGVDSGKTMLYDSLKVRRVGANYNHFPLSDQYGNDYVKGLLSERLIYDPKSIRNPWKWEKIPGHERNEPLDIMNYAMAARNILPANLDAIDRRLKAARMGKESPKPAPKPQPKHQKRRQKVRMEEW